MKNAKIAIVGAGNVGSTAAYALMLRDLVSNIMLTDIDQQRVIGQVNDLSDALSFSRTSKIYYGGLKEAGQADIVIITAGKSQKVGQKRSELAQDNAKIVRSVINEMRPITKDTIIIVVTNPVDVMTMIAQDVAGISRNHIFGSGTFLDTQRLRSCIGSAVGVAEQSVHAYVLGEHGDSQFVAWSTADIGGVPILNFPELDKAACQVMAVEAKEKVYEIIQKKGATFFGIASCITAYCENILFDQKRVLPLSCYQENLGVSLSMPAVLGARGVEQILDVPFNEQEQKLLQDSVTKVRALYRVVQ